MRLNQRAAQLTLLPEARLASPPAWQDDGREVLTCDGSGLSFSACAGRLLPAGSWQRTLSESLASSLTGSTGCAVSLRVRATKCGRSLLVPTTSAPHTEGTESGSWPTPHVASERTGVTAMTREGHWSAPGLMQVIELVEGVLPREVTSLSEIKSPAARALWPTARAEDSESAGAHVARGTAETLTAAARLWPTATSGDGKASGTRTGTPNASSTASHPGTTLTDAANGLWATPQSFDATDIQRSPEALARAKTKGGCANLREQVQPGLLDQGSPSTSGKRRGWPSPNAALAEGGHGVKDCTETGAKPDGSKASVDLSDMAKRETGRGSLNPAWVLQLLGFPDGWLDAIPPSCWRR